MSKYDGWKRKWKGSPNKGAWIHMHPQVENAIVEGFGIRYNGKLYNTLEQAKSAALSVLE